MDISCKIVYQEGFGEIVEKKSRFLAYIFPVDTEEQALERIAQIRREHYSARHNCFAYVIGEKNEIERCSDDGEPSGTAGRPMLEVLTGQGIHNAVAIVTRYFGGTLLGTGGLVRAYTDAVKAGLLASVLLEQKQGLRLLVSTDYNDEAAEFEAKITEITAGTADIAWRERVSYCLAGREAVRIRPLLGREDAAMEEKR